MARQWSINAEVQITNNAQNETNQPVTYTEQDGNVVRMIYTWTSNPEKKEQKPNYGFQRGNMVFTSTPPRSQGVQDSGYNSDHVSPNYSRPSTSRSFMPYDRRCRSTCSITLSTDINVSNPSKPCGRTQSLHYPNRQNFPRQCSPVFENCEDCKCTKEDIFSTHFCTKVKEKINTTKDMTTQTVETKEKSTSPITNLEFFAGDTKLDNSKPNISQSKFDTKSQEQKELLQNKKEYFKDKDLVNKNFFNKNLLSPQKSQDFSENRSDSESQKARKKDVRKTSNRKKRNHVSKQNNESFENTSGLLNPQDLEISRNSPLMRSPDALFNRNSSNSSKRRTVHIDVYCTASDSDSNSTSSLDSDDELFTVLKSEKQNVYHRRAGNTELPLSIKKDIPPNTITRNESFSDDYSTCYPSRMSSYSTIRDFESSFGVMPSFSTLSSAGFHFDNSTAEISCRSSCSDMESVIQKALPNSDSFEYADSADRERIKRMEQMWNDYGRLWKSPQIERNKQIQQQKIQEYIDKKLKENIQDNETNSELSENVKYVSDEEASKEIKLKRGSTVSSRRFKNEPVDEVKNLTNVHTNTLRAQKFGPIIGLIKKPGHHVGPAKNPDCSCAHCTEFYNKGPYRNRAHSVDNLPFNGTQNWRNILKSSQGQKN